MVNKIFNNLVSNKKKYLKSKKGKDFENRIESLISIYFTKLAKPDEKYILKNLKLKILNKKENNLIKNTTQYKKHFIIQPYGTQSYPDIIIFFNNKIISIEIKFTENKAINPLWNSGIPRLNGIYIFGSYGFTDLTFFLGKDIITLEELNKIEKFNKETDNHFIK